MKGVQYNNLELLLEYIYNGQCKVPQDQLNNFLAIGEELGVNGLALQHQSQDSVPIKETGRPVYQESLPAENSYPDMENGPTDVAPEKTLNDIKQHSKVI